MDLTGLMKQAKKMQADLANKQQELALKKYAAEVSGGAVKVVVNGNTQMEAVEIDEALLETGNKEMLEDMVLMAVNNALEQMSADKEDTMSQLTGGINMPGMF